MVKKTRSKTGFSITSLLFKGVLILAVAWGASLLFDRAKGDTEPPAVLQGVSRTSDRNAIKTVEFMSLFDRKKSFSSLAKEGYYTVVEVYLDTCAVCKRLESGFKPLVDKRRDTYIRRVHFPETGIQFSFSGTSQQEVQAEADEMNALMQSYDFCGTPHVVIFGPDKQIIQTDGCDGKRLGTRKLQGWITAETGLLKGSLGNISSVF